MLTLPSGRMPELIDSITFGAVYPINTLVQEKLSFSTAIILFGNFKPTDLRVDGSIAGKI